MSRLKRFGEALGRTFSNMGNVTGKVLENLEKADKEMQEKMKKVTGNVA